VPRLPLLPRRCHRAAGLPQGDAVPVQPRIQCHPWRVRGVLLHLPTRNVQRRAWHRRLPALYGRVRVPGGHHVRHTHRSRHAAGVRVSSGPLLPHGLLRAVALPTRVIQRGGGPLQRHFVPAVRGGALPGRVRPGVLPFVRLLRVLQSGRPHVHVQGQQPRLPDHGRVLHLPHRVRVLRRGVQSTVRPGRHHG